MAKNANFVSHKKSKQIVDGKPKLPEASALVEGEIAINFGKDVETLSIKNESGDVVTFSSDNYYTEQKLGSGFTGENSGRTVTEALENIEITVDQVLDNTTSASTNPVSSKAVYSAVTDNELVWANAFAALSGAVSSHTEDANIHLTSTEKTNVDSLATNIAAISGITSTKVSNWNTAYNNNHTHSNKSYLDSISGSVGSMAYQNVNSYSSATQVATALSGKQASGNYVTTDTNQTISGFKTFGVSGISFTQNDNNDGGDIYKDANGGIVINGIGLYDWDDGREIALGTDSNISVSSISFGGAPGDYFLKGDITRTISGNSVDYVGIRTPSGKNAFIAPTDVEDLSGHSYPIIAEFASGLQTASGTSDDLLTADGYSYSKTLLQNVPEERPNGTTWSGSMDYNYYYNFGYKTSISITSFVSPTTINGVYPHAEYKFMFYSLNPTTTLSFPANANIVWAKGESPTIEASTMYEFSIVYNNGYFGMWTSWVV